MESILTSIKKTRGIQKDYTHFDLDIIVAINSVLAILTQLGVGPKEGFSIADDSATWGDFMGEDKKLNMVKTFVTLRVWLLFDPPQNASLAEAINRMAQELEWRIQVAAETKTT